jgi:uncharacterized protein (DUF934 family)
VNNVLKLKAGLAHVAAHDPWTLIREAQGELPSGPLLLPVSRWWSRQDRAILAGERLSLDGIWLGPDDEVEALKPFLSALPLIAVDFPSFRDGRGYSQAYLLRTRLGWGGELRAIGDVLRDQLSHMRQCGFDCFAVREDKSIEDALKGLAGVSVAYGRSAIEPRPLFRRR